MRFRGEIETSDRIRTIEVKVPEAYSVAVSAKAPTADRRVVASQETSARDGLPRVTWSPPE